MMKTYKSKKIINKKNSGYALLELLFYIAIFAVLSLVVINAMIIMAKSFKETSIQAELVQSGTIMEKMSREIRQASDINSISTNDLILKTSASKTTEFKLNDSNIELWENSGTNTLIGYLNTPNIIVSALSFTQITTVKGKAIKVSLTLKSSNDKSNRLVDFYNTIVLRGSY